MPLESVGVGRIPSGDAAGEAGPGGALSRPGGPAMNGSAPKRRDGRHWSRRWHRILGLVFAVPLLWLTVSGLVLRHADRLRTVGQLASGMAHELGTPLNVISGRAKLISN